MDPVGGPLRRPRDAKSSQSPGRLHRRVLPTLPFYPRDPQHRGGPRRFKLGPASVIERPAAVSSAACGRRCFTNDAKGLYCLRKMCVWVRWKRRPERARSTLMDALTKTGGLGGDDR